MSILCNLVFGMLFAFTVCNSSPAPHSEDLTAKLEKAKANLNTVDRTARNDWAKAIDSRIKAASHGIGANQALQISQQLRALRTFGQGYADVPTDDSVIDLSAQYYSRIAIARWSLYLEYEKLNRLILDGKIHLANEGEVVQETIAFMKQTEEADRIKAGNSFKGYRHDPRLNMNMPIELRIKERLGHQFSGKIILNNGDSSFNVVGTVAGLQVSMKKVGVMEKGKERYFEYAGFIVGDRLLVNHQGITAGKKLTEGWSWMNRK